jgi:hypothetical protein
MVRVGHTSPAAALGYQHGVANRDVAAKALSGLAEASFAANPARYSQNEGDGPDEEMRNAVSLKSPTKRAADQDRTGIISLEG